MILFTLTTIVLFVHAQTVVQVIGSSNKQLIDGFGCSLAFMGQAIQSLPLTPRSAILQTLFSTTSGAGFSILRTRISPYLSSSPGQYDYTSDAEEVGTRYLITQAKTYGVSRFLGVAWTPPPYCKTNQAANGGHIDSSTTSLNNYATYLSKYITTYKNTYGITWYAISPQNEPEIEQDYESCVWDPSDFVTFLGTNLKNRFTQDGVSTLVLAPESNLWSEGTISSSLLDATARAGLQIVSAHPYFGGNYVDGAIQYSGYDYLPLTKKYNKQLWATEFSNISSNVDNIADTLLYATYIHKHLTVPETNAWSFWWGATNKPESEGGIAEGLIQFDASGSYTVRKRLWAIAQFARFIRPGWNRIDATAEPTKGVHVSAYKDAAGTQTVIIAVNEKTTAVSLKFNLYGIKTSSIAAYRTSATESLVSIGNVAVSQGTFTVSLAARSITTFVGTTNTNAAAFSGTPAFITEFNSLAGSTAASGDLVNTFSIGTIDPSNSGSDETALFRQSNTAQYIQYPIPSPFTSFVLSVQRNAYNDGLSFAAVSSSGALTSLTATKSAETAQPGYWFLYTYTIASVPSGTTRIRISFAATNAEWNPRLTRLVIS